MNAKKYQDNCNRRDLSLISLREENQRKASSVAAGLCRAIRKIRTRVSFNRTLCSVDVEDKGERKRYRDDRREKQREENAKKLPVNSSTIKSSKRSAISILSDPTSSPEKADCIYCGMHFRR